MEGNVRCYPTEPAYSGGKLEIGWTFQGERLPVVVDIESLAAKTGTAFVLDHKLDKPLGTIRRLDKSNNRITADGPLTHLERDYVKNEIAASHRGFKHRPSITVYDPDPKNVRRIGEGESLLINGRQQEGPFFAVYNGRLRNIALVSTPGDYWSDESGSILAQSKGENDMSVTDITKPVDMNAETQGPTATESKTDNAVQTAYCDREYLIEKSLLVIDGEQIEPKPGDFITENGKRYEVSERTDGRQCFRPMDATDTFLRVYTFNR